MYRSTPEAACDEIRAGSYAASSMFWADSLPCLYWLLRSPSFVRLLKGPALPDRVVAIDLIGVLMVCIVVVTVAVTAQQAFLDVAIVVALISCVGTVAYSTYIERSRSSPNGSPAGCSSPVPRWRCSRVSV